MTSMPAHTVADPLVPLPIRVPSSLKLELRVRADAAGVTMSDMLRSHLTLSAAKPLARPRPRRRQPRKLGAVSGTDPVLLRNLSAISANLSQISRNLNQPLANAAAVDLMTAIALLFSIESRMHQLAQVHAPVREAANAD